MSSRALVKPGCSSAYGQRYERNVLIHIPQEAHIFQVKFSLPSQVRIRINSGPNPASKKLHVHLEWMLAQRAQRGVRKNYLRAVGRTQEYNY